MSTVDPSSQTVLASKFVGPATYDTISAAEKTSLKRHPRVTIGNSKRLFLGSNGRNIPAPDQYSAHHKMTERRSNSRERNAYNATIGHERRLSLKIENPTPGPDNYNSSQKEIGDGSSIHVPFGRAIRPISARPGQVRKIVMPGPSDYKVVNTNVFLKRASVIPAATFTMSERDNSVEKLRSTSPGPSHYRVQSAVLLKK